MTTAEALAQIREALSYCDPLELCDDALTALDSLEAENALLRAVVEAARDYAESEGLSPRQVGESLRKALAALEEK